MRSTPWSPAARRLAALLATFCFAVAPARAQALPGGISLGMTVPQLQEAQPALTRVPHPARLAGGLVGSWSGQPAQIAGVSLVPTFFFADGQLQRIEYLARDGSAAAYESLLAWGRRAWGTELAANEPEGAYASWSSEDTDAYLQLASTSRGGPLRLVVKRRAVKDAGEL